MVTIASAIVLSVFLQPLSAFAAIPHGGFGPTTKICASCHDPHQAASSSNLFSIPASGSVSGEISVCYPCHDGSGASTNVKTGSENSFALTSGHRVENTTESAGFSVDMTNRCSDCHAPHATYASSRRLPKASIVTSSGTFAVTGANNTWCLACHNDAQDWYKSTTSTAYPAASTPAVDASGYPVTGTFPGRTVYNDVTKNRHVAIPAGVITDPMVPSQTATRVAGDCQWCHTAHRGKSKYDSLPTTFGAPATSTVTLDRTRGDYAAACFTCHGGGSWEASGAVNIKRYAVKTPDDASATSGHRIKTTGATLPLNSPLPCYDCHNPHGSTRNNKMMLADTLGRNLEATVTAGSVTTLALRVREYCFTCHSTSGATPKVWDSVVVTYTPATTSMSFKGLRRDGTLLVGQIRPSGYSLNQNYLRLKTLGGSDHHSQASTKSCYDCHGKTYSGAGSPNVHAPTMGVSNGQVACYGCHAEYQPMEDNTGTVVGGAPRLTSYHHVMGSATNNGDYTPATSSTYPTSNSDVYCVSCHVDHDKFNANKGANLRSNIAVSSAGATNTDFIAPGTTGNPGVCVSCHMTSLTKQNADQASSGTTYTVVLDAAGYGASAHNYTVASTFTSSTFKGNCVKCHNDTLTKSYQTSVEGTLTAFGVHTSAEARVLARLGGTLTNPYEERFCYKCHSKASESQGSTWTASVMKDRYGVASMSATSVAIYSQMQLPYGHKVGSYSGIHKASRLDETLAYIGQSAKKHIECTDCHDSHDAGKGTHTVGTTNGNKVGPTLSGVQALSVTLPGTLWTAPTAGAYSWVETATYEYQICLKCHTTGANAALTSWNAGWTDVALEFNTANRSYHPVVGAVGATKALSTAWMDAGWQNVGTQTMTCSDCHGDSQVTPPALGPHGSSIPHVLKGYWPIYPGTDGILGTGDDAAYTVNGLAGGTQTGILCDKCHAGFQNQRAHSVGAGNHASANCYRCHILVPHGGKLSRLIGDGNSTMPARYSYQGVSTNMYVSQYTWNATSITKNNCSVLTGTSCAGGSGHNTNTTDGTNW